MKKIYSLALMLVALLCPFVAQASTLKLNVDHAAAIGKVVVVVNAWPSSTHELDISNLVDGVNSFELDFEVPYGTIQVTASSGWIFKGATNPWNEEISISQPYTFVSDFSVADANLNQGFNTWTIKSAPESTFRTSKITLNIEDASKVKSIKFEETNNAVTYDTGENEVLFAPEDEHTLVIAPENNGIYQVLRNDVEVASVETVLGTRWKVTDIADGDRVNVVTTFPDIDVPLHFTFTNPGSEGVIKEFTVNGEVVEPDVYLADGYTVKLASTLHFAIDSDNYRLDKFTVNGTEANANYGLTQFVGEELSFVIDAIKYEQFTKRIIVNGPAEGLKLRLGMYESSSDPLELVEGENLVPMNSRNPYFHITCGNAYELVSVKDGETDILAKLGSYSRSFTVNSTDDLVIEIAKKVFDNAAYFFFEEDPNQVLSSFFFSCGTYSTGNQYSFAKDVKKGYNVIEFNNNYNPFSIYWYTSLNPAYSQYSGGFVYRNGERVTGSTATNYTFQDLTDGDVIKVFFNATAPATYNVTFEDNTEDDLTFTAHHDYIKPIEDLTATHSVLAGTHVKLTAEEGKEIAVKVGENEVVTAPEHEFFVTENTHVVVNSPNTTGVANVAVDAALEGEVFNLQGIRVAPANDFNELPAGIYIVNGKKVVKK